MHSKLLILAEATALALACDVQSPTSPLQFSAPIASVVAVSGPAALYDFYDCAGPSGTPNSFSAVKTATPPQSGSSVSAAAAFRLVDGSAIFVVLSFGDAFNPPGIETSGNATVTCSVTIGGAEYAFSGLLAPR